MIGYIATALNVVGNLMLARKTRAGWVIRLVTNAAWLVYAVPVERGVGPMGLNHILFAAINLYGWYCWSRGDET